jgi:hypothetical protein
MRCALSEKAFQWQPRHINMAGFVADMRCDFRLWYKEHYGGELDDSGYYRYWLTYNGEIPNTVRLVSVEYLQTDLPDLLQPFANGHALPPPPKLNTSPHEVAEYDWIPKATRYTLEHKFSWYFAEGKDQLWRPE